MNKYEWIGIDIGTTNSVITPYTPNRQFKFNPIKPPTEPFFHIPTSISFSEKDILTGIDSQRMIAQPDFTTFSSLKSIYGQRLEFLPNSIKGLYKYKEDNNQKITIDVKLPQLPDSDCILPDQLQACFLKHTFQKLNINNPENVVIAIPETFQFQQRIATINIGLMAGCKNIKLISEPTAAALAYLYDSGDKLNVSQNFLVFDFGGGTLDINLVNYNNGILSVIKSNGNNDLGGDLIDKYLKEAIFEENKIFPFDFSGNTQKVLNEIRLLKETGNEITLENPVTKEQYQIKFRPRYIKKVIDEEIWPMIKVLFEEINLTKDDNISKILFVGGSSLLKDIREHVKEYFDLDDESVPDIDVHTVVSRGAAIYGAIISGKANDVFPNGLELKEITPNSIYLGLKGGKSMFYKKNSPLPYDSKKLPVKLSNNNPGEKAIIKFYQGDYTKKDMPVAETFMFYEYQHTGQKLTLQLHITRDSIIFDIVDHCSEIEKSIDITPKPMGEEELRKQIAIINTILGIEN